MDGFHTLSIRFPDLISAVNSHCRHAFWRAARSIDRLCQPLPYCSRRLPMATMNVFLSAPMKNWVEAQTGTGRYSNASDNASDYVRDPIRRDEERAEKIARMQQLATEGLESGVSPDSMTDIAAD
jgi:antitoxin ParD1/3/4